VSHTAPWAEHAAVLDFPALLEDLQYRDRLAIGLDRAQHAAVLLRRLSEQQIPLDSPEKAATWLGPVLCVTARERALLLARLRQRARVVAPRRSLAPLVGELLEVAPRRRRRLLGLSLAGVVLCAAIVMLVLVIWVRPHPGPGSGDKPLPDTQAISVDPTGWPVALGLGLLLPVGFLLLRRRREIVLPPPDRLPSGQWLDWLDSGVLQGPLRLSGMQRRLPGRWLDLPGTIAATVHNAGWPTIVRGGRPRTPEHLVIVDLRTANDPQMLAAFTLVDRLRKANLRTAAFQFTGRPDRLEPLGGGPAEALARVASRYGDARLVLVSDGGGFYDRFSGIPVVPAPISQFRIRVLVTPTPRAEWSDRELAYDRLGWQVAEQSTAGIFELARWLAGPRDQLPPLETDARAPDLAILLERDARLFSETPPKAEHREQLQQRLSQWLDQDLRRPPDAYDALRVLAMGTQLSPGTVERVLGHLADVGGPRPDEEALRRLMRLPWLVRGHFPFWLREDLLRSPPARLADTGRQAWLLHLADAEPAGIPLSEDVTARLRAEVRRRLGPDAEIDTLTRASLTLEPGGLPAIESRDVVVGLAIAGAALGLVLPQVLGLLRESLQACAASPGGACAAIVTELQALLRNRVIGFSALLLAFLALGNRTAGFRYAVLAPVLVWAGSVVVDALLYVTRGDTDGFAGAIAAAGVAVAALGVTGGRRGTAELLPVPGHPWANAAVVLFGCGAIVGDTLNIQLAMAATGNAAAAFGTVGLVAAGTAGVVAALMPQRIRREGDAAWLLPLRAAAVSAIAAALILTLGFEIGAWLLPIPSQTLSLLAGLAPASGFLVGLAMFGRVRLGICAEVYVVSIAVLAWPAVNFSHGFAPPPLVWLVMAMVLARGRRRLIFNRPCCRCSLPNARKPISRSRFSSIRSSSRRATSRRRSTNCARGWSAASVTKCCWASPARARPLRWRMSSRAPAGPQSSSRQTRPWRRSSMAR
jgi:hypothetical protein